MRRLFLLRHAKSAWDDAGLSDYDRPLAPRGKQAADRLARHFRQSGYQIDLVLCSSARRAADTWQRISKKLQFKPAVSLERELYLASAEGFVTRLRRVDDDVRNVLLLAHNPGLEYLAAELCGEGESLALDRMASKFPTGALATIRINRDHWSDLAPLCGYLESFVVPRALSDG